VQGQGYNPDMVASEVNDLIDFVAVALRRAATREAIFFVSCLQRATCRQIL
jgi:hypothetical protein